jgi:hypothetical protein
MQGIAQKILAAPERYSVDMLRRAMETGLLPAYIGVPLIQARMQAQKQAQQGASLAQPSPDQQPTVAEEIMGQGGVEALPSNLPQEYADGGIVAFAPGGEVGYVPETFEERIARLRAEGRLPTASTRTPYVPETPQERAARARAMSQVPAAGAEVAADTAGKSPSLLSRGLSALKRVAVSPLTAGAAMLMHSPEVGAGSDIVPGRSQTPPPEAPPPAPAPASSVRGASGASRPTAGITGLPAAPTEKAPELTRPGGPSARSQAEEIYGALDKQLGAVNNDFDARIRAARGLLQGEAFEGYKKQLEDEARKSGSDRADAKNMALFKAGLAMMAGTSRHALENIGRGALVGAEDWQTAARELRAADKERRKEFALIEQARRAEKAGNIKDETALLESARNRGVEALTRTAAGISAATGMDRAEATQFALNDFQQSSANYRMGV